MQVPFQDVPAHLIIEGETELGMNLDRGTTSASKQKAECLIFPLKPKDLLGNGLDTHRFVFVPFLLAEEAISGDDMLIIIHRTQYDVLFGSARCCSCRNELHLEHC